MPDAGWPLRIRLGLNDFSDQRYGWAVRPSAMGVCGKLFSRNGLTSSDMVTVSGWTYRHDEVRGLDRLAEGMRLVELATPPSNRPVGAWSTAHDLMGVGHSQLEEIHARTEAELTLKQTLFREGLENFRGMIELGRIEPGRNDWHVWYVMSEIDGLDQDPLGSIRRTPGVLDDINEHLERKREADFEP
jgi:hypothetical protein